MGRVGGRLAPLNIFIEIENSWLGGDRILRNKARCKRKDESSLR